MSNKSNFNNIAFKCYVVVVLLAFLGVLFDGYTTFYALKYAGARDLNQSIVFLINKFVLTMGVAFHDMTVFVAVLVILFFYHPTTDCIVKIKNMKIKAYLFSMYSLKLRSMFNIPKHIFRFTVIVTITDISFCKIYLGFSNLSRIIYGKSFLGFFFQDSKNIEFIFFINLIILGSFLFFLAILFLKLLIKLLVSTKALS